MTAWIWDLTYTVSVRCGNPPPGAKKKKKPKDGSQGGAAPGPPAKSKIISIWRNVATP